jgi:DHA2 family multidrug resistance protein
MPDANAGVIRPASPPPISDASRAIVTVCVVLATFMQALDSTIANVALPYMQGAMSASQDEINWVLTSYIVAAAIMTAPIGFLAARFGRTRLFVTAVLGFTVASVLCGLAQSLDQIVIFRLIQGACGAALVPLSQAVLFDIYTVERRAFAIGLWVLGVNVGPVLGPILGGWLTGSYSWRWVFYINVPVGIAAAIGMVLFMKETPYSKSHRLDWVGFGALSLAIAMFQLLLDRGETLDWFSSREIILEACLAGLGAYIFLVQSSLSPTPFLSPRLFRDVNFVVGNVFIFVMGLVLYATLALLAPYLQDMLNYPVITAGVVLAPRGLGMMLATVLSGRLLRLMSARALVGSGLIMSAYTLYEMNFWTPDISQWSIVSTGFVQGVALSMVYVPLATITFSTLPAELRTEGAGVYALMRNLGSAIGISVTGALLVTNTQVNHAEIAAAVTPFNRVLGAAPLWNPGVAAGAAALNVEVTRQANVIAYMDDFKLMFLLTVLALPLVLLIRPPAVAVAKAETVLVE